MGRTRVAHLELWQRLNVVGAVFALWLGTALGLAAAAISGTGLLSDSIAIPLRPMGIFAAVPGLILGTYWVWRARELQAGSFFETVTETENGLVQLLGGQARTFAFYATIMGLIVLMSIAANYQAVKDLSALFHLTALASVLFTSYGASYLYLHVSSR